MTEVEIVVRLPTDLAKDAKELGILSSEHIEELLRADIRAQLNAMADDPDIQREIQEIELDFRITESDGLDQL